MGQCFGLGGSNRGGGGQGSKSFDYTPRKSWKYRDDHVMNQFKALSMESEDDDPFPSRTDAVSSESEEEVYTKQPRGAKKTNQLAFSEEDEDDDDDDDDDRHPSQKSILVNRGFQLLQADSPSLSPHSPSNSDTTKLITTNFDEVT